MIRKHNQFSFAGLENRRTVEERDAISGIRLSEA
jgi:hypothetical protein